MNPDEKSLWSMLVGTSTYEVQVIVPEPEKTVLVWAADGESPHRFEFPLDASDSEMAERIREALRANV